jgi:hypothetical protein
LPHSITGKAALGKEENMAAIMLVREDSITAKIVLPVVSLLPFSTSNSTTGSIAFALLNRIWQL